MLVKQVVINASPLIVLFKSFQSELLPQLFSEIIVPQAVWEEIIKTEKKKMKLRKIYQEQRGQKEKEKFL